MAEFGSFTSIAIESMEGSNVVSGFQTTPARVVRAVFVGSDRLLDGFVGDLGISTQDELTYRAQVRVRRVPNEKVHLYFFTSDGCAPCRQVEPGIEALIHEGYPVSVVHVDRQPQVANRFGVDRTPTVVMIDNGKMVGRHAGLIDGVTLKKWFAAVGVANGSKFAGASAPAAAKRGESKRGSETRQPSASQPISTKVVTDRVVQGTESANLPENFSTPTMHRGTRRASTDAEQRAMNATIRLKLEDTNSISYATGTVIHTHGNESLVMTCGHVFRDNKGKGVITAEYNFYGNPERAPGKLIHYDAGPRDIALVAIRTQTPIQPVRLASVADTIRPGVDVFSIGCDRGDDPTIRHTKIKAKAAYDASPKYDIFGRPVDGRSGGGLFTSDGRLIGVCNSKAIEVDEGIYTAVSTLHWELAHTGLAHLFPEGQRQAAQTSTGRTRQVPPERYADSRYADVSRGRDSQGRIDGTMLPIESAPQTFTSNPGAGARANLRGIQRGSVGTGSRSTSSGWQTESPAGRSGIGRRAPSRPSPDDDKEVLILVRSKSNPAESKTISIDDPTPELINYLKQMR